MHSPAHRVLHRWFGWILPHQSKIIMLAIVWLVAGFFTFNALKRDLFPNLALPSVQILIQNPGKAASELELTVAQPAEQALAGLPGVRRVNTILQTGLVQIIIAFEGDTDPWRARQIVAEKLASIQGSFPSGTRPPLLTSAAGRLNEIQELVLSGPSAGPMALKDHAVRVLVPRLQAVPGVARAEVLGGEERQLHITLRPDRLRLMGTTLSQVLEALDGSHQDMAAGILEVRDKAWFVTLGSQSATIAAVQKLPVPTARGMTTLGELSEITDAKGFRQGMSRYRGQEVVALRIVKQLGAEALGTAEAVRAVLPELRNGLPSGMSLTLFYDQGEFVSHALGGVTQALLLGGFFVALVLITLLGNLRGALIVIVTLPLATLGAAIPLSAMGLGLNAMTLGGLAISVGLLVDAGVIMVENLCHRLVHVGAHTRKETIIRAASEVGVPILTAVLVILAVFIPLLAVGGVAGKLYAPLSVAVASAMTISLVLSFTLVPALVDRYLPPGTRLEEPRFVEAIKRLYRPALHWALRHGVRVQLISLALTLPCIWLGLRLESNFLPTLNEGAVIITPIFPAETSLEAVDQGNLLLEARLSKLPGVKSHYRRTGRGEATEDPMPHYASDILVTLQPGESPKDMQARLAELGETLPYPVEITTPMGMKISEGIGGTPADIQVKFFNPDLTALSAMQNELQKRLAAVEGVIAISPDVGGPLPKWQVTPDEDALRRLGVPRPLLLRTLQAALQGIPVEARFDGSQRIERVVRISEAAAPSIETLRHLPLVLEGGRIIEVGQVASFAEQSTPSMIRREAGQRRLGFNVRTRGDLAGTARRIEKALQGLPLPAGTSIGLGGQVEEARETQRRLAFAIAAALSLVVGLLYLALDRWREVFVVIATLPVAFAGGLFALWVFGESWNVSSIVGMIGLFGVAVQNSLVLISQTKGLMAEGMPLAEAIHEACLGRVRPKLMTAGSAMLGLLPMLFGVAGSELERPLAIVMIGGLITSTLFTLLVLPSFYAWVGGDKDLALPS